MFGSRRRKNSGERGSSVFDYALITAVFAMTVLAAMNLVGGEATSQLASTQTRLTNAAALTAPSPLRTGGSGS